jgi:hypothetical protein
MSLSLPPLRLLTYSGPLLSLSICTVLGPLLSLSISIGDCSGDHPVPRLRSGRAPPGRPLRRPPRAVAPLRLPPCPRATTLTMRRRCGGLGPFVLHHINDIEISHPELYNDGQFVVHRLTGEVEWVMAEADGVVVNTFLEMEPEYVTGYVEAWKMKVWTIGPVSLHHRRMGTTTLIASRGGGAREASLLDRPQQAGGGARWHARPRV